MVVAASRNHLYRRRLQVVIDAGPRNHIYLLTQQVKIRSSPRNQKFLASQFAFRLAESSAFLAEVAPRPVGHNLEAAGSNPTPQQSLLAMTPPDRRGFSFERTATQILRV